MYVRISVRFFGGGAWLFVVQFVFCGGALLVRCSGSFKKSKRIPPAEKNNIILCSSCTSFQLLLANVVGGRW
jgi:hypothetical protein